MSLNAWQRWLNDLARSTPKRKQPKRPAPARFRPLVLPLEDRVSPAVYTFSNPALITINDASPASPYPSSIAVAGVVGAVIDVDVQVNSLVTEPVRKRVVSGDTRLRASRSLENTTFKNIRSACLTTTFRRLRSAGLRSADPRP